MVGNRSEKPWNEEQLAFVAEARSKVTRARGKRVVPRRDKAPAVVESDDSAIEIQYRMELAAHRETTDRLLAEKDLRIEALEQLVAELRAQREAASRGIAGDS